MKILIDLFGFEYTLGEVEFKLLTIGRKYNFGNDLFSLIGFERGIAYREINFLFITIDWLNFSNNDYFFVSTPLTKKIKFKKLKIK